MEPINHSTDSECKVDPQTNLCMECFAYHGAPCYHCRAKAFHLVNCITAIARGSKRIKRNERDYPADSPRKVPLFVAVGLNVKQGTKHIASAISSTMAQRIARALNLHSPNPKGK